VSGEPRWISMEAILVLHDRSIALHGGAPGVRDDGLLESALSRPLNRFHYDGEVDLPTLAATYLIALASNHPFVDGNKRAAFLAAGVFLHLNGLRLFSSQVEAVKVVLAVAAGEREVEPLTAWLRHWSRPSA
jgi:death-on-curing protein